MNLLSLSTIGVGRSLIIIPSSWRLRSWSWRLTLAIGWLLVRSHLGLLELDGPLPLEPLLFA